MQEAPPFGAKKEFFFVVSFSNQAEGSMFGPFLAHHAPRLVPSPSFEEDVHFYGLVVTVLVHFVL